MGPSRTDAPHAARRDEPAARAVLLHQHCFTCDPAGLHVVACSTSVTCSTFLLLQHILHLQHVFTCDPPTLHVLPAVLHRSCHPPSCASYRPSCDCSTCGPPTSACCTCTAPAFFLFHGTCSQHERTAALAARLQHGAAQHNPAVAHASSSPSRARCASSSPPSAPRSRLRRCAARREMARPRRRGRR